MLHFWFISIALSRRSAQRLCAVPLDGCRCEPCGTTQPSLETKEPQARNGYEEKNGEIKKNSFSELQRVTEKIYFNDNKCEELTRIMDIQKHQVRRRGGEEVKRSGNGEVRR